MAVTETDGPTLVPVERYISPEFAALEAERLWPRTWQMACSVGHVAEPGDYFEHRAGWLSVLIVRDDDGELRAFQNVCRHRGNALCQGAGSLGHNAMELRCGYHGWTWDLAGNLKEIPSRKIFGPLRSADFPLIPVQVGVWGPLVFVNLDLAAEPLEEFLEGVPADSAWARLDEFECVALTVTPVEANWKVVADGFSETYHVQGIHKEMLGCIDDVNAPQRLWGRHGVSYQEYGVPSPRLGRDVPDQVVWDAFVLSLGDRMGYGPTERPPVPAVPEGQTMRDVIAGRIRDKYAAEAVDLSWLSNEQATGLSQYNLFPNATVLVWGEMLNVLCARPGRTPDEAELMTMLMFRRAAGATRTRPVDIGVAATDDFGFVLNADVAILRTVQQGLHQPGLAHLALAGEECRIINLHRNLEQFLGLPRA